MRSQARRAQRLALIEQLANEQAAAEAMLEELKTGKSLEHARAVGQRVHGEMEEMRRNAGMGGQNGSLPRPAAGYAAPQQNGTVGGGRMGLSPSPPSTGTGRGSTVQYSGASQLPPNTMTFTGQESAKVQFATQGRSAAGPVNPGATGFTSLLFAGPSTTARQQQQQAAGLSGAASTMGSLPPASSGCVHVLVACLGHVAMVL